MKQLITTLLLLGVFSLNAAEKKPVKLERPQRATAPEISKDHYGAWLDKDGFVKPGPKIKNWIDTDRDRVDDRYQAAPGKPAGKPRPEVKPEPKPEPKPEVKPKPDKKPPEHRFPLHWGHPPARQTRDLVDLPGKFGKGSGTLAKWIEKNLREDGDWHKKPPAPKKPLLPKEGDPEGTKPKAKKPERPTRPALPKELKAKLDSYKKEKETLGHELKKAIKELKKPNRKAVREVVEAFHKAHKDRLDAQKELGKEIKEGFEATRPERPSKPEVSKEVETLRKQSGDVMKKLHESKKAFMEKLKASKREDHKEILGAFREEQGSLMNELKDIQKQIREEMDKGRPTDEVHEKRRPPRRTIKEKEPHQRRPADRS